MKKNLFYIVAILLLLQHKASAQCSTSSTPSNNCNSGDMINAFSLNNIASTGSNNSCPSNGYISFTQTWTLTIGSTYPWSASVGGGVYPQGVAIWIDVNNNNQYENTEMLTATGTWALSHTGTITIPANATAATVRMRVRCAYYSTINNTMACQNSIGSYGETEDSYVTLVSPCQGPTITDNPTDENFCIGGHAGFTATATSAATYRWQVNTGSSYVDISDNSIYSGTATNSLSLSNIPAAYNNYKYRLKATSGCGTPSYSTGATLTFFPPVAVTSQTTGLTACGEAYSEFNVTASGPAQGYQWQYGTLTNGYTDVPAQYPYVGTNSAKLEIINTPDSLNGRSFRCIVLGECSDDTSAAIPIDVITGPYISKSPASDTAVPYTTAIFDVETLGSNKYELYWQSSTDNGATFVNINNSSLYVGTHNIALGVLNVHSGLSGMQFRCILKSTDPACGLLRDTSEVATLYVGHPTGISSTAGAKKFDVTLYPNPVNGNELYVNAASLPVTAVHIKVFDKLGRALYNADAQVSSAKTIKIPVQNMAAGIYSVQISDRENNLLSTSSFTKQ